jgi:hypothetical protein
MTTFTDASLSLAVFTKPAIPDAYAGGPIMAAIRVNAPDKPSSICIRSCSLIVRSLSKPFKPSGRALKAADSESYWENNALFQHNKDEHLA